MRLVLLLFAATASMIQDMAENVGGTFFTYDCIVPIGGDPHIHEPTPRDARSVNEADLILVNGLTFEGWLNELIENSGTKARVVRVTEGVQPIVSSRYQNATDPHAWMDAKNGQIYVENIHRALKELLPEHADSLDANYESYQQKLEDMDQFIFDQIASIPEARRILVTSHDAFQYYGRRYGLRLESILGVSTDADIQTSDIIRLNKIIKESKIPAVFVESTINPKVLSQLAEDNHISVGGKLFSDSLGDEDSPAPTYLDMLRHNTLTIVSGLTMSNTPADTEGPSGVNTWILFLGGFAVVALLSFLILKRGLNHG
jgi:ABC-type Zn uptake system ZnuABC Zn-binding protein ZnuA